MHTAHEGWEDSKEVWDAPRVAGYRGEEVREALWRPGLWEEEVAWVGEWCWVEVEEDWAGSR